MEANWTTNTTFDDLVRLNDQRAMSLIPAMAVFSSYMLIGLVGNILVCYIIGYRFKSNNQNFLIVCLAIMDILNCLITMPTDIIDMRFSYNFPSGIACKVLRFIMSFTCLGSGYVLIVIAADRYKKICTPLGKQMSRLQVKLALGLGGILNFTFSCPTVLIFGLRTFQSPIPGQYAKDCSTDDSMKYTYYPLIYTGALFLAFIIPTFILASLYISIMVSIARHNREMKKTLGHSDTAPDGQKDGVQGKRNEAYENDAGKMESSLNNSNTKSGDVSKDGTKSTKKTGAPHQRKTKTTIIAFVVTLVFILSFLPYLCLQILKIVFVGFDYNLQGTYFVLHNILLRSYHINSIANPLIYGALNIRFREEVKILLLKLCFCR